MKKFKVKSEKGITLIALVITIIVLIILATVSINLVLGEDGIIEKAELSKELYQNAAQKEDGEIEELEENLSDALESAGIVPTVEELQSRYEFEYYSSMSLAVKAVNEGKIKDYADKTKDDEEAVAGIYTKEDNTYVVLLKDNKEVERIKPEVNMTINLGGHELSSDDLVAIDIMSGNVIVDGRLKNSTIKVTHIGDNKVARTIQTLEDCKLTIKGGQYITNTDGNFSSVFRIEGEALIQDAIILSQTTTFIAGGIELDYNANVIINNCDITVSSTNKAVGINMNNTNSTVSMSNCNIKAYSNYTRDYTKRAHGIVNKGTLTLNNCYVMGTYTGVHNSGILYVNGGTYEGYGHGGFAFGGTGTASWVRNATIRESAMPEGYTADSGMNNNVGFYIGGEEGNDNIVVNMDNCNIYGSQHPIILSAALGEKNNKLYISNSKINTDKKIKIDNGHMVYIGVGNNFTAEDTTLSSSVETTNDKYIQQ